MKTFYSELILDGRGRIYWVGRLAVCLYCLSDPALAFYWCHKGNVRHLATFWL